MYDQTPPFLNQMMTNNEVASPAKERTSDGVSVGVVALKALRSEPVRPNPREGAPQSACEMYAHVDVEKGSLVGSMLKDETRKSTQTIVLHGDDLLLKCGRTVQPRSANTRSLRTAASHTWELNTNPTRQRMKAAQRVYRVLMVLLIIAVCVNWYVIGGGNRLVGVELNPGPPKPAKAVVCHGCKKPGHINAACPSVVCNRCKQQGHRVKDCKQPKVCRICQKAGHLAKQCTQKKAKVVQVPGVCNYCKKKGHEVDKCDKLAAKLKREEAKKKGSGTGSPNSESQKPDQRAGGVTPKPSEVVKPKDKEVAKIPPPTKPAEEAVTMPPQPRPKPLLTQRAKSPEEELAADNPRSASKALPPCDTPKVRVSTDVPRVEVLKTEVKELPYLDAYLEGLRSGVVSAKHAPVVNESIQATLEETLGAIDAFNEIAADEQEAAVELSPGLEPGLAEAKVKNGAYYRNKIEKAVAREEYQGVKAVQKGIDFNSILGDLSQLVEICSVQEAKNWEEDCVPYLKEHVVELAERQIVLDTLPRELYPTVLGAKYRKRVETGCLNLVRELIGTDPYTGVAEVLFVVVPTATWKHEGARPSRDRRAKEKDTAMVCFQPLLRVNYTDGRHVFLWSDTPEQLLDPCRNNFFGSLFQTEMPTREQKDAARWFSRFEVIHRHRTASNRDEFRWGYHVENPPINRVLGEVLLGLDSTEVDPYQAEARFAPMWVSIYQLGELYSRRTVLTPKLDAGTTVERLIRFPAEDELTSMRPDVAALLGQQPVLNTVSIIIGMTMGNATSPIADF